MTTNFTIKQGTKGLFATGMLAMLVACGGGGGGSSSDDSSPSSSPVVARGAITQLGSIYVNGVKYETPDSSTYSGDDNTVTKNYYQVGQVVSIRGTRNGATGTATEVEYEAEIEGQWNSGAINGITIVTTPKTNGPSMSNGNRYEISGVWVDDSTLEATFVRDDGDLEDEIKGFVQAVNPGVSFEVRDITFNYAGPTVVAVNDYVEVHFSPPCAGSFPDVVCTATIVDHEDDFFDQAEGLEIEIEGAANLNTAGCPMDADFKIDNTCIDWDNKPAVFMDGLLSEADVVNGTRVEAEGHMNGGLLVADKIKGRGNRVRVSSVAAIVSAANGTFTLLEGNINVSTKAGVTQFEDGLFIDTVTPNENIDGQTVEVRGVRTDSNSMLALRIKLTGLSGGGTRHELRAEVDDGGTDTGANSLTVMGVISVANGNTELEVEDIEISPGNGMTTNADIDAFLGMIDADSDPVNGPRDVVEIGVDINSGDGKGTPYIADEWEIEEEDD